MSKNLLLEPCSSVKTSGSILLIKVDLEKWAAAGEPADKVVSLSSPYTSLRIFFFKYGDTTKSTIIAERILNKGRDKLAIDVETKQTNLMSE